MVCKIAIFLRDIFIIGTSSSRLKVIVFERDDTSWNIISMFYVNITPESDIAAARQELAGLAERLGDCRIAAGPDISGILYHELDRHGFAVFEAEGFNPETLDGILQDLKENEDGTEEDVPTTPIETKTPGVYLLDLQKLQEQHPDISSKQALLPFLDSTPFYELRLICNHVPPWLENGAYNISSEQKDGINTGIIRKKQCIGESS